MTSYRPTLRFAAILLGAALLAGCAKSPPAGSPPAPDAPPPSEAVPAPDASDPAEPNPAQPAQPPAEAPPPTDPSPAPTPTKTDEPGVENMRLAQASGKAGLAAQLRYQFDAAPLPNQAVTLHLAAVARVPGQTLQISLKETPGVQFAAGPVAVQKVSSGNAYRQQFAITRGASAPASLRVLVTMDSPAGSAFGFFDVPLESGIP